MTIFIRILQHTLVVASTIAIAGELVEWAKRSKRAKRNDRDTVVIPPGVQFNKK